MINRKRKKLNNKGFTLIEIMFSVAIFSFILILAIQFPTNILKSYKDYQGLYSDSSSLMVLDSYIRADIDKSKGEISEGEFLNIGKVKYSFKNDGIKREDGSEKLFIKLKEPK